jgi:hypothetical protein
MAAIFVGGGGSGIGFVMVLGDIAEAVDAAVHGVGGPCCGG